MTTFIRVLKIGFVDFWRNRWLSLAATMMMAMTIFTVALFILLNLSINQTAKTLQDKIDVAVFFKDSATDDQIKELQGLLQDRSDVKSVAYISREDAQVRLRDRSKYQATVLKLLDQGYGTKLPRSLSVISNNPQSLETIATFIQQPPYDITIENISYKQNKSLIDKFINLTSFIKKTALYLSILFSLIAVLVIYNTIRLTILMRREEIEIMQLVGATGWFVRFPFILEGILYGIIATIVTTAVLIVSASAASPFITQFIGSPGFDFKQFFLNNLFYLVVVELGFGLGLGAACSYIAVRRFLL